MQTKLATKTVVGLFDDFKSATNAAERLQTAGIPREDISVIAGNDSGQYKDYASGTGEVGKGVAGERVPGPRSVAGWDSWLV